MNEIFSRNELFWGAETQENLRKKHVVVFGLGGVGGYCAESLARAGVGKLTIVDFDVVSKSNINRQLVALNSTVNQKKTELFKERLKDINPEIQIFVVDDFYTEKLNTILSSNNLLGAPDFVADAIDTMRSKISLLEICHNLNIPVISSMGAGNRIDPTQLYVCDIKDMENKNAPFVSNIIYQLKKRGIESGITVVASREKSFSLEKVSTLEQITTKEGENIEFVKMTPSSTPFVASCAGIFMASHIVQKFIERGE